MDVEEHRTCTPNSERRRAELILSAPTTESGRAGLSARRSGARRRRAECARWRCRRGSVRSTWRAGPGRSEAAGRATGPGMFLRKNHSAGGSRAQRCDAGSFSGACSEMHFVNRSLGAIREISARRRDRRNAPRESSWPKPRRFSSASLGATAAQVQQALSTAAGGRTRRGAHISVKIIFFWRLLLTYEGKSLQCPAPHVVGAAVVSVRRHKFEGSRQFAALFSVAKKRAGDCLRSFFAL